MGYSKFVRIFNATIFEKSKPDLIRKIAEHPGRYVGLFRPTKPKAKIIQNLLQSHEIRFGDAFETLIREYLGQSGFKILAGKFSDTEGNTLQLDQFFSNADTLFFAEQKIRDDHDSTKKRGQINNFESKIAALRWDHPEIDIVGFFYFIDDSFRKNANYYEPEIEKLAHDYGVVLHLVYGREMFDQLGKGFIWDEILDHLTAWKKEIPDLPEINFDKSPEDSANELKDLSPAVYRKLLSNTNLDDLFRVLFPENATLSLLAKHFKEEYNAGGGKIFKTLQDLCNNTVKRLVKS